MNDIRYGQNLDAKSEAFIKAVYENDGEATTTEIRQRTGLTAKERNYRFGKLKNMGLITVREAQTGYGDRRPPKVAELTDAGVEVVEEDGISEEAEEWLLENELTRRVSELETRVDMLERKSTENHERLTVLEGWRETLAGMMFGER